MVMDKRWKSRYDNTLQVTTKSSIFYIYVDESQCFEKILDHFHHIAHILPLKTLCFDHKTLYFDHNLLQGFHNNTDKDTEDNPQKYGYYIHVKLLDVEGGRFSPFHSL